MHFPFHRLGFALAALAGVAAQANPPASIYCPPIGFVTGNVAQNPSFETAQSGVPVGTETCWTPRAGSTDSAAKHWTMHSSNGGDKVCSTLVPSSAPGNGGSLMLKFKAGGNEGGVFQAVPVVAGLMLKFKAGGNEGGVFQAVPVVAGKTYMFSAWVKVAKGQVALQSSAGNTGPVSWSTKHGEWEQLRVCTDASGATDTMVIYNQDANGGLFYVDRVELRETVPGP